MSEITSYLSPDDRAEIRARIRKNKMTEDKLIDMLHMDDKAVNFCRLIVDGSTEKQAYKITKIPKDRDVMTEIESKLLIELLYREKRSIAKVTSESVIESYANIAFTSITDVIEVTTAYRNQRVPNEDGELEWQAVPYAMVQLRDFEKIPDFAVASIKSIKQTRYGLAVEMHDKITALGQLGNHLGIFQDAQNQAQSIHINMKGISDADFSVREAMRQRLIDDSQHAHTEDGDIITLIE